MNNLPYSSNLCFELSIFILLWHHNWRCSRQQWCLKIPSLSSNSNLIIELMKLLWSLELLIILLNQLSVLSSMELHLLLIIQVIHNLLLGQDLILSLNILNNLFFFGLIKFILWISKVVLLFTYEFNTHFVDLVLFLEGTFVIGEIILNWWIIFTPSKNLTHWFLCVTEIGLLAIENCAILKFIKFMRKYLMLNLSFHNVRLTLIRWSDSFVSFTSKYSLDLGRLSLAFR